MVAAITEGDPGVESEKASHKHPWLTGTTPRGGQGVWAVQFDVGEL
jgi:hypothetical protein